LKNLFDIIEKFGNVKFGEQNSLNILDYSYSLNRYFSHLGKKPHGAYKFAEINNMALDDFKNAVFKF